MKFRLKATKTNVLFALEGLFTIYAILIKNVVNYIDFDVTNMKAASDVTSVLSPKSHLPWLDQRLP